MITTLLNKGFLAQAFLELRRRTEVYPGEGFTDRLDALEAEYKYMSDFMLQGYQDDKRGELFKELLQRIEDLDYDLRVRETLLENSYIKTAVKTASGQRLSSEAVLQALTASASPAEHYASLSSAFLSLLTSGHWRRKDYEEWSLLLISSDLSPIDAATIVGGIMMSGIYHFSYYKSLCLARVYALSSQEDVRQRAFVGCMLSVCMADGQYGRQISDVLKTLFSAPKAMPTLLEMQVQLSACAKAEADSTEISKSIMPDLLRNQPFRFTKDGIEEREEESDCIDLDADERRMEAMTAGINKIMQMQKNGSDIFFGGFRQMKRFPFFYQLVNWFMPFTAEHPGISKEMSALSGNGFVEKVTERGPFCNSDKYSFIIAISGVIGQMPANVRSMMEEGQVGMLGMQEDASDTHSPSLLRLQFLQDLYRFCRLNPAGSMLLNPFCNVSQYRLWTVAADYMSDTERRVICGYMMRDAGVWAAEYADGTGATTKGQPASHPVGQILDSFEDKESVAYLSEYGYYMMRLKHYDEAIAAYSKCLKLKTEDPAAMRGMARACYGVGEFAKAAFYFDALHTLFPKRISYALNYAMAMVMDGAAEAVLNDMYKLEYENPDSNTVRNTLGWVLLHAGKAEQALSVYEKLLTSDKVRADFGILLNAFYSFLVNGKVRQGIGVLQEYTHTLDEKQRQAFPETLSKAMTEDSRLLEKYSIGEAERSVILSQFAFFTP